MDVNGLPKGTSKRTPRGSIFDLPGSLPKAEIPDNVDHATAASSCLKKLPSLSTDTFIKDALWRDSFALTGTLRTFFGASKIEAAWNETASSRQPLGFKLTPGSSHIARHGDACWVDAGFTFETAGSKPLSSCSGFISIVPDENGGWKIWVLSTILENLKGQGNVDMAEPQTRSVDAPVNGHQTSFECVVVGGGQSGLATAGRLETLGVSYVLIDRYRHVGDSWNTRYDSMKLHTLREYAHLPFERTFGPEYPELLKKQDLANGYQKWVKKYGINVWTSTSLVSCSWNEENKSWSLTLLRDGKDKRISTSHVVFALGHAQKPRMPEYPNRESFKGTVIHSAEYKSPSQWKGKAGVIIGTANTAHDVAEDMVNTGLSSVTMVQRNCTWILPLENYQRAQRPFYNSELPTELADRLLMSGPVAISRHLGNHYLHAMARAQTERFEALERVGFKTEVFGDLQHMLKERLGGHYMDVGASAKVAKGLIKVKSNAHPIGYTPTGLEFSDGTELPADVIVFTTGFVGNMRHNISALVSPEVESQLEDVWGLDAEGELLGAFKYSGHPQLWYMAGDLGHARYYSRFVALQIKADLLGTPLDRYTRTP